MYKLFFLFFQKQTLTQHVQMVHNTPKEIRCRRCEYTTFSKQFFHNHMEKMHKVIYNVTCEYEGCDHITSSKDKLQRHMKSIHLGINVKKNKLTKKAWLDPDALKHWILMMRDLTVSFTQILSHGKTKLLSRLVVRHWVAGNAC